MRSIHAGVVASLLALLGCIVLPAPPSHSTTTLRAAQLPSLSPPLALFVLRVANDELALSDRQRTAVEAYENEAEAASRQIDDARHRLTGELLRSLASGRIDEERVSFARANLVMVVEVQGRTLARGMVGFHAQLAPDARSYLRERVVHRIRGWERAWTRNASHPWLDAFAGPALAPDPVVIDASATAKAWADERTQAVTAALSGTPLDPVARIDLERRLRTGDAMD